MKGLLIKDFLSIKFFGFYLCIVCIIFSFQTKTSGVIIMAFPVYFASILPSTAIAYDEKSKWDSLAITMPLSKLQMVLSKYVLGYLTTALMVILTIIVQIAINVSKYQTLTFNINSQFLTIVGFSALVGILLMSIQLPISYLLGSQISNLVVPLLTITTFALTKDYVGNLLSSFAINVDNNFAFIILGLIIVIAINILSVIIATKLYTKSLGNKGTKTYAFASWRCWH